ncbi:hypothetical protein JJB67_12325 [Clostridium perfringens]|uniref:hypothetical protein n=1 Tax=Clostridium perfringens TaxID=1502 RepID=UPI001ABA864F|nr:hypothetical protein [Clostridium perfringens]MBO3323108.1 hypothetical protein [Clostridium perfringens]MBO3332272.1 hypothetical protein [Clostridium perfringens]
MIYSYKKYKDIENFFNNNPLSNKSINYSLIFQCNGITTESNNKVSLNNNCFNCLFCMLKNKDITKEFLEKNHQIIELLDSSFSGELIEIPKAKNKIKNKYYSFEKFTEINETKNIQPWANGIISNLASERFRTSMEINIPNADYDRDGRLDIGAINTNYFLGVECKISLEETLKDQRFIEQFEKYSKEIKYLSQKNNIDYNLILLIGGNESDLLPYTHPECTSKVGNKSIQFYDLIKQYNIKFMSANALWLLCLNNLLNQHKYYLDLIIPKIFSDKETLGLLSCGKIMLSNDSILIKNI